MDHMSFEHLGTAVLAYGVGKSHALLGMLADLPGDKCLYSTPSYAVRLADVAAEAGVTPRDLRIKKGFFFGRKPDCRRPHTAGKSKQPGG